MVSCLYWKYLMEDITVPSGWSQVLNHNQCFHDFRLTRCYSTSDICMGISLTLRYGGTTYHYLYILVSHDFWHMDVHIQILYNLNLAWLDGCIFPQAKVARSLIKNQNLKCWFSKHKALLQQHYLFQSLSGKDYYHSRLTEIQ